MDNKRKTATYNPWLILSYSLLYLGTGLNTIAFDYGFKEKYLGDIFFIPNIYFSFGDIIIVTSIAFFIGTIIAIFINSISFGK